MIAGKNVLRSRTVAVLSKAVKQVSPRQTARQTRSVGMSSRSTRQFFDSTQYAHSNGKQEQRWKWGYVGLGATLGYIGVGAAFWTLEKDSMSAHAFFATKTKPDAPPKIVPARELHGKWKKVEEVGQEKALLQMSLNWVFRQAATLLTNLDISIDDDGMKIITQGGLVISITEKYGFDGGEYVCSRRDNRSGKHIGKIIESTPTKAVLRITWDDPFGGEMYETFEVRDGKLTQTTKIKVNKDGTTGQPGEWYTYYSVFERQG